MVHPPDGSKPINSNINCKTTPTYKQCPLCNKWKTHDKFHRSKSRPSGLTDACKPCTSHRKKMARRGKCDPKLLLKHGKCTTTHTHKRCTGCSTWKRHSEFYSASNEPSGLHSGCKVCQAARKKARWKPVENTPVRQRCRREYLLKSKYGLTLGDYDAMLKAQNGKCALCHSADSGVANSSHFHVDHDHKTGNVRGLLCLKCNMMLGLVSDDPVLLYSAASYLTLASKDYPNSLSQKCSQLSPVPN